MDGSDDPPDDDYEVGYGKPPVATRFKKGQSGNPSGRTKRRDSASIMRKVIDQPVAIRRGGRICKAPVMEVLIIQLRDLALKGDLKAARELREIIASLDDPPELRSPLTPEQTEERQQILAMVFDYQEINELLVKLKLVHMNEHGRVKLCPDFFERLFGPCYQDSTDPAIQELLRGFLVGTRYI